MQRYGASVRRYTATYIDATLGRVSYDVVNQGNPTLLSTSTIVGFRGPRNLASMHDCVHTVQSFAPVRASFSSSDIFGNTCNGTVYTCGQLTVDGDASISPSDYDAAIADMCGEIPTDLLLPNFILDIPSALIMHHDLQKVFSRKPKSWADAGLLYSFGLKPLASDIVSLMRLTSRINKRLKYLRSLKPGDPIVFRRSYPVDKSGLTVSFLEDNSNHWYCAHDIETVPDISADAQIFAKLLKYRIVDPNAGFLAYLDATGFSKPGSVIWEAIPFSFVADWFRSCGRGLNALNTSAVKGSLMPFKMGHQSHINVTAQVYGVVNSFSSAFPNTARSLLGAGTVRLYKRSCGLPSTNNGFHFGVRQGILSGLLLLQRS